MSHDAFLDVLDIDSRFQPFVMRGDSRAAVFAMSKWRDLGMVTRLIRGRKTRTVQGLFDEFAAALQFPPYFGENLDAFNDCISDLDLLPPGRGYVIIIIEPEQILIEHDRNALRWLIQALTRAAEEWAKPVVGSDWLDRPAIPFHVVLVGGEVQIRRAEKRWRREGAMSRTLDPPLASSPGGAP